MRICALALALVVCLSELRANMAAPAACPAGVLIADVNLTVQPPGSGTPKPLRQLNLLRPGYIVRYTPNNLPSSNDKKGEIALVLAPSASGKLVVLDSKPAAKPAEWVVPIRAATVALVYGPQGLNEKKMNGVDPQVVSQLADYADKATQTEALIGALMRYDKTPTGSAQLEAALTGFSSRFGAANARLDRTKPMDEQAGLLLQTLNPALSSYDPLAPQQTVRLQQSASLAASVAALFFGNGVGLAAGGTSMLLNLRTLMFPNVEFRSAFAQAAPGQNLTLCAKPEAKSRTRLGYLWATRLPDTEAPHAALAGAAHIPVGIKVKLPLAADSPLLRRAAKWALVTDTQELPVPVTIGSKELELDLSTFQGRPGAYRLRGDWDWDPFQIDGDVHVYAMPKLAAVRLEPSSQDHLIEKRGPIPVSFMGDDFQFVQRATLRSTTNRKLAPLELPLPSRPGGPEPKLTTEIDTSDLAAGEYKLALQQPGNTEREVPVRVLPPNPVLQNLPLRVNLGEPAQLVDLKGTGLDRIERITSSAADVALIRSKAKPVLQVRLPEGAARGSHIDLELKVEGVSEPVPVPGALEVVGPRPRIRSLSSSMPGNLGVRLRDKELPAGSFTTFSVSIDPVSSQPYVNLQCSDANATLQPIRLRAGEQNPSVRIEQSGPGSLFLSVEPSTIGPVGCTVTATIEAEVEGKSDPQTLGRVVRLPRIESFELTQETAAENTYIGILKGQDLETIEKAGWNDKDGLPVRDLPTPIAREGARQMLKIALPWPPPAPRSPVYIWLRGEKNGRSTEARY